jgi:sec-independent protein translocase protein TatA
MFGRLGLPELMIILFIVIIIFGANRLPQLGRGIGSAIKNFKEGIKEESQTAENDRDKAEVRR